MSPKACLVVLAALPACTDPAVQGTSIPDTQTSDPSTSTAGTDATSSPTSTDPTTDATASNPTTGPAPTCSDGQLNQDESDVDCGGSCPPCGADAGCAADGDCQTGKCDDGTCLPLYRSCLELHTARPALPNDAYPLDPDGDGADPLPFFCDMNEGGWTQIFLDEFQGAPNDAWSLKTTGECGDVIGGFLGPFGMGDVLALPITARQVPHAELKVFVEVLFLDSRDPGDGTWTIRLDGVDIFTQLCEFGASFTCGQYSDICGNEAFPDGGQFFMPAAVAHTQDAIGLEFTSNLTEAIDNEAWGLDKVLIFVK
jgi:hypothetical protein